MTMENDPQKYYNKYMSNLPCIVPSVFDDEIIPPLENEA